MAKTLEDLGLKDEPLPTAGQELADLPEFGTFEPPPQPGPFRFKLPADLSAPIYDLFDAANLGQRVRIQFDREHPLLITQSIHSTPTSLSSAPSKIKEIITQRKIS